MHTPLVALSLAGINTNLLLIQLLNGLALGVLYILIASGMSVIFGMTDILNFAHGVFYMLGAYLALSVIGATGSFLVALLLAPIGIAVIGAGVERLTLHRIYDRGPLYHVLLTFGLVLVITDLVEYVWGPNQQLVGAPDYLAGAVELGPIFYPKYRLFTIAAGAVIAVGTWAVFRYTRFGLIIRAGAQDRGTVRLMGVDVARYFTLVFAFGSLLAGTAGVLAAPFLSVNPNMGNGILIIAFIVVVVGGMGSYLGSVVAAFLIAFLETLSIVFVPELSSYLIYLAMLGILLFRPQGLFGTYEVRSEVAKISFAESIEPVRLSNRWALGVLAVLVVLPLGTGRVLSSYMIGLVSLMFIWGLFALSLDIVMGYLGLISFGHAAFWGVGAYAVALTVTTVTNSFLAAVAVALVVTTVLAWGIGALSVRLTGVYFAMITFAAAQLLYTFFVSQGQLTGGSDGFGIPDVTLLGVVDLAEPVVFYYLALAVLVGCYYVAVRVMDSPFGRTLAAIRESERRVSFLGYDTEKYKRRAFAFSGAVGGLAGALFMVYQQYITPDALYWFISGDVLFAMILGGIGTLYGPIVGGAVLVGLEQILPSYIEQWRLVIGLVLIGIVLFAPRGLASVFLQIREALESRRGGADVATEATTAATRGPAAGEDH
jgi:branched-chain amino acid transport system permease protein